ncbi:hypothetical protein S245_008985, partial [Arachis hypogaea]
KSQENAPSRVSKSSTTNAYDTYSSVAPQSSSAPANNTEDDFDNFDPRGTSAKHVLKKLLDVAHGFQMLIDPK